MPVPRDTQKLRRRWAHLCRGLLAFSVFACASTFQVNAFTPGDIDTMFRRFDRDGNGAISQEEFSLYKVDAIFNRGEGGSQQADRVVAVRFEDTKINRATFSALDQDGNDTLSASEVIGSPLLQFDAIDANGDGVITRDELARLLQRIGR